MVVVLAVASAVVLAVLLIAAIIACGVRRRRKRRHDLKITADLEVSKKLNVFDYWLAPVFQRKKNYSDVLPSFLVSDDAIFSSAAKYSRCISLYVSCDGNTGWFRPEGMYKEQEGLSITFNSHRLIFV